MPTMPAATSPIGQDQKPTVPSARLHVGRYIRTVSSPGEPIGIVGNDSQQPTSFAKTIAALVAPQRDPSFPAACATTSPPDGPTGPIASPGKIGPLQDSSALTVPVATTTLNTTPDATPTVTPSSRKPTGVAAPVQSEAMTATGPVSCTIAVQPAGPSPRPLPQPQDPAAATATAPQPDAAIARIDAPAANTTPQQTEPTPSQAQPPTSKNAAAPLAASTPSVRETALEAEPSATKPVTKPDVAPGDSWPLAMPQSHGAVPTAPADAPRQTPTLTAPTLTAADPAGQVSAAMVHISAADGTRRISLQLTPKDLGRVEIAVTQSKDGPAEVTLTVEHAKTLDLLKGDQAQLSNALDRAGLPMEHRVVTFHLMAPEKPMTPDAPRPSAAAPETPASSGTPSTSGGTAQSQHGSHPDTSRQPGTPPQHTRAADIAGEDPSSAAASAPLRSPVRFGLNITA